MRKSILFFLLLLGSFVVNAQITKIKSAKLSPDKKEIAFICYLGLEEDLFLYNIEADSLSRLTTSEGLSFEGQYKASLNWLDNSNIIFLSKHTGVVQQYVLDIQRGNLTSHSTSVGDEYSLCYSPKNEETYYISSIKGREPAVFRRGLISYEPKNITTQNVNYGLLQLSPNNKYLAFSEMPMGNPIIYSLDEARVLKLKLTKKNVRILSWSLDSNLFLYKNTEFRDDSPIVSLSLHNLDINKSSILMKNINGIFSAILMTDGSKYMYSTKGKSYLVDIESNKIEEFNIKGDLDCWVVNDISLLIIDNDKAFIYDILKKDLKNIIN